MDHCFVFLCATITVTLLFIAANIGIGIAGIIICIIVYVAMVKPLLSKQNSYSITIDNQGLRIGEDSYPWYDLLETYIMYKYIGRSTHCYLLLETKTNQVIEFDLDPLAIGDNDIVSLIEAYKKLRLNSVTNANKAANYAVGMLVTRIEATLIVCTTVVE